ncbi:MAG: hypothetical protein K2H74_09185, partial [Paramuribaculum sp.]|nr:hypothetical protein [Paramuribaculum sp.]
VIYELNQKTSFINNTLKTNLNWDNVTLDVTGSLTNDQSASLPDYFISNDFKLIQRIRGKHIITILSKNEWESMPQTLSTIISSERSRQRVRDHAFYTDETIGYSFTFSGITVGLEGGVKGYIRSLNTVLTGLPDLTDGPESAESFTNVLSTNYFSIYATPKMEYWLRRVNFTLNLPLSFAHYTFDKALANRSEAYFSPSLSVNWKPNNRISMGLRGGSGRAPMDLSMIQPGYVMTNYRSFRRGVDNFYNNTSQNLSANFSFKHTRRGVFANAVVLQSWNQRPYTLAQQLYGDYVLYSYSPARSKASTLFATANIGKTLDFMRGSANINGSFNRSESHLLSESQAVNSVSSAWSVGAKIN